MMCYDLINYFECIIRCDPTQIRKRKNQKKKILEQLFFTQQKKIITWIEFYLNVHRFFFGTNDLLL